MGRSKSADSKGRPPVEHCLLHITFSEGAGYLVHRSGTEKDEFLLENDRLVFLGSKNEALAFLKRKRYKLESEFDPLDLRPVERFLKKPGDPKPCLLFYRAWNTFGDLAQTFGQPFAGYEDLGLSVQDELFWGCGFDGSIACPPEFTSSEFELLQEVLEDGMGLLQTHLPAAQLASA